MVTARILAALCLAALAGACSRPEPITPAAAGRVADIAATVAQGAPEVAEAVADIHAEARSAEPDADVIRDAVKDILAAVKPTLREADAPTELVFLVGVLEVWLATP